jgi:hypothetical protein
MRRGEGLLTDPMPPFACVDGTAADGANGGDPDYQRRRRNQIDTTKRTETEPYPIGATRVKKLSGIYL